MDRNRIQETESRSQKKLVCALLISYSVSDFPVLFF